MKFASYVAIAIAMAVGAQAAAEACLPNGCKFTNLHNAFYASWKLTPSPANQCDLSGKHNCCSGFCDKPKDWAKGICK